MEIANVRESKQSFDVLQTARTSQTAVMTLAAGEASGPKRNEHPKSEQVLYLVEGELLAEVGERSFAMRPGDSVIVEAGAPHKFTNTGKVPALTFNVYSPPAY